MSFAPSIAAEVAAREAAITNEAGIRAAADALEASIRAAADTAEFNARVAAVLAEAQARAGDIALLSAQIAALNVTAATSGGTAVTQLTRLAGAAEIASIGGDGTTTTVNTVVAHGYTDGDYLTISGTTSYNGNTPPIDVISLNEFRFASPVLAATETAGFAATKRVFVQATTEFADKQQLTVTNDAGDAHATEVEGAPSGGMITLKDPIPTTWLPGGKQASIGKTVSSTLEEVRLARGRYRTLIHRLDGLTALPGAHRIKTKSLAGAQSVELYELPGIVPGMWGIFSPFTLDCEIRKVSGMLGAVVSVDRPFLREHAADHAVLWTNDPAWHVQLFGAKVDNATDDSTPVTRALADCHGAGGGTFRIPDGTLCTQGMDGDSHYFPYLHNVNIEGSGWEQTTWRRTDGGRILSNSNPNVVSWANVRIRGITFDSDYMTILNTGAGIYIKGDKAHTITIEHCRFWRSYAGVHLEGVSNVTVRWCLFENPANQWFATAGVYDGQSRGRGVYASGGCQNLVVEHNRFRYVTDAIHILTGDESEQSPFAQTASTLWLNFNKIDLGWYLLPAIPAASGTPNASGFSGTNAVTLTDSDVNFSTLSPMLKVDSATQVNNLHTCRLHQVLASGSGATVAFTGTTITDTAKDFAALRDATGRPIIRGEIVRTATAFAVIINVVDLPGTATSNQLVVEEWLSLADNMPVATPAAGTAYEVHSLILGRVIAVAGNSFTVQHWYDFEGWQITDPAVLQAATTRYEITYPRPNYPVFVSWSGNHIQANFNILDRGYSDQMSLYGRNIQCWGNTTRDGQDIGIVIHGPNISAIGNRIRRQGSYGMYLESAGGYVGANVISDTCFQRLGDPLGMGVSAHTAIAESSSNRNVENLVVAHNIGTRQASMGPVFDAGIVVFDSTAPGNSYTRPHCIVLDYNRITGMPLGRPKYLFYSPNASTGPREVELRGTPDEVYPFPDNVLDTFEIARIVLPDDFRGTIPSRGTWHPGMMRRSTSITAGAAFFGWACTTGGTGETLVTSTGLTVKGYTTAGSASVRVASIVNIRQHDYVSFAGDPGRYRVRHLGNGVPDGDGLFTITVDANVGTTLTNVNVSFAAPIMKRVLASIEA